MSDADLWVDDQNRARDPAEIAWSVLSCSILVGLWLFFAGGAIPVSVDPFVATFCVNMVFSIAISFWRRGRSLFRDQRRITIHAAAALAAAVLWWVNDPVLTLRAFSILAGIYAVFAMVLVFGGPQDNPDDPWLEPQAHRQFYGYGAARAAGLVVITETALALDAPWIWVALVVLQRLVLSRMYLWALTRTA